MSALRESEAEPVAVRVGRLSRELALALDEWKEDLGGETWVAQVAPASSSQFPISYQNVDQSHRSPRIPGLDMSKLEIKHYWPVFDALTAINQLLCGVISQPRCEGLDPHTTNAAGDYLDKLLDLINGEKDKLTKQLLALPEPRDKDSAEQRLMLLIREEVETFSGDPQSIAGLATILARIAG